MKQLTGFKAWVARNICGLPDQLFDSTDIENFHAASEYEGYTRGIKEARIKWAVFPMPFTREQLNGVHYGEFVTPIGFGTRFGECTIPAPGPHGYEQRAYYVNKEALDGSGDLTCHHSAKFTNPSDSDQLVPVIVTVLR